MRLEIQYSEENGEAQVLQCGISEAETELPVAADIPAEVDGYRIKHLAPYVFSNYRNTGRAAGNDTRIPLNGPYISAVSLPDGLRTIGNYAFYGCTALQELKLTDSVMSIGGGVFMDCKIQRIEVRFRRGIKSCLKDILGEVRNRLTADLIYESDGGCGQARLCYPEYYEEEVENGPARIFEVHYLGTGYKYRQCFQGREVDYRAYDQLFTVAAANEAADVLYDIIAGRVLYPHQLSEAAKQRYERYISEHVEALVRIAADRDDFSLLSYMTERKLWNRLGLNIVTKDAYFAGKPEFISYFMNEMHRLAVPEQKQFDL